MSKNVALLNSRQGLYPSRNLIWVKNTIEAIKWVKENRYTLLSSVGMNSWELVTTLGALENIPMRLFIPNDTNQSFKKQVEYYREQFQLESKEVEYLPVSLLYEDVSREQLMKARDRKIIEHADLVIPVSLRKTSGWYKLLKSDIAYPHINNNFVTPYNSKPPRQAYQISVDDLNPALNKLNGNYLFHYTRQPSQPWPDELLFDYYYAISESSTYPRSAFATLLRIVEMKKIIGSCKNIPDNFSVTAFTALNPNDMTKLIRWRKRYHQMSFEPYAIGFDKSLAVESDIVPVIYYDTSSKIEINEKRSWRYQSRGKITDWSDEKEFRFLGDFNFSNVPADKMILITRFKNEAEQLQKKTGIRSLSFTIY